MDLRTAACLAAVFALSTPAARAAADDAPRDRKELRQDRREVGDDRRDLAKLEELLGALDAARAKGDRRAILRIDTEVERELAAEARESRMEEALDRIELRRDRRELVGDHADRREARDDRRDLRDDRHDRHRERKAQARRDLIARDWAGLRGRFGPAEVGARRTWLLELIDLARQEVTEDRQEIREDRRELREDRREDRPGRPERR